jgi:hypothetical protein
MKSGGNRMRDSKAGASASKTLTAVTVVRLVMMGLLLAAVAIVIWFI